MRQHRSPAQALIWLCMMLPVFLSVAGLAIDGGILMIAHRQLESVADGAARAGATRIDIDRVRTSGGAEVQLDRRSAASVAHRYVADALRGQRSQAQAVMTTVSVAPRRVQVELHGSLPTAFLRLAHIDSVAVVATATADVLSGIRDGNGQ